VRQNHLSWLFGVASVIVVTLLFGLFVFLQSSVSARVGHRICIPQYSADTVCYEQAHLLTKHKPTAIAVNPLGTILALGTDSTIELWNLATGELFHEFQGHRDLITSIAISPDDQTLASSSLDGTIKLWSLQTGTLITTIRSGRASTIAFSPDGRTLASASRVRHWADGVYSPTGVQFWDVASQQRSFSLGDQPVRAIAFSPDGHFLATGGHKAYVWQLKDGEQLYTLDSGEITGLMFCQDSQTLLTASSRMKLWDLGSNGALLNTFESGASDLALSPDGQVLATAAGGTINFWNLQPEVFIGALRGSWYSGLEVNFALRGDAIVASGTDGVRIWRKVNS
jgi:WD40 repeat protein